jgi:hypothetical protein
MDEKESVYNPYTNCIQPVYKVYTQVRLGKDSIDKDSIGKGSVGKDSIDKDSLDKDSLGKGSVGKDSIGKDRIEEDSIEVVEGSIVEGSTYTSPTAAHTAHALNNEDSFLMASATADKGEALHTAPITNYGEMEGYSTAAHTAHELNNEDSFLMASATADKGEALHTAPISNFWETEDYAPTPTHYIYDMKENSACVANSGGFIHADDGEYSAAYSPLQEEDYEGYGWELPCDYVSENPPPIGLDDGYFSSPDDKDAPPEESDLPWSYSGVAPKNDRGGYYSRDCDEDDSCWAISPAPKRREATETSTRGFGETESALTAKKPQEDKRTDISDDAATASMDDTRVKPIFGDYGRGIVCLSEWQLSDLKDRLGEQQLNHYMDKLATFISQRGARIRSHYDTILKWYNEDAPQREWQSTDASWRANNSPKSYQKAAKPQAYNPPPQHERYGNFDPNEAFRAALRRTYGENYDVDSIEI